MVAKAGLTIAKNLVPPGIDDTTWWRIVVSASIVAIGVTLLLHIMHACGWGPWSGEGFAMAADIKSVQAELIAEKIDAADLTICMDGDDVDPIIYDYRARRMREYAEVTGHAYENKPCGLLEKLSR